MNTKPADLELGTNNTVTPSALAATLGELEQPSEEDGDSTDEQQRRFEAFEQAAQFLPVRSAADAALVLSLASKNVGDIEASQLTEEQLAERLAKADCFLRAIMRWLSDCHGVKPLWTCWAPEARRVLAPPTQRSR